MDTKLLVVDDDRNICDMLRLYFENEGYNVKTANDEGGSENNIKYDMEFLDGVFTHLALVDNPRYERANIVFNSKTVIENSEKEFRTGVDKNGNTYVYPMDDKDNTVDFTNRFAKTPTLTDVKKYVTKIVEEGSKFATLSPDWFVDTKVNSKRKGHIIYSDKWNSMSDAERDRHNEYVLELEELLRNAEYLKPKGNTKKDDKKDVEKYHYFRTFVKIGENKYEIIFDTEQYVGESEDKPQTVHLYNIHEINKTPVRAESENSIKNTIGSFNNIINDISDNFNPNVNNHEVNNNKEQEMALLDELKKLITRVENEKGENMDDKEKIENEKVDKRKLIDEVGGILKGKVDDELIRTIIGKMEKMSYDESEAGTADNEKEEDEKAENCGKKVKNEDKEDKEEVKEVKEDVKEDVENKCKNSVDNSKTDYFAKLNEIYNSANQAKEVSTYVSRAEREKAAEDYFAR